MFKELKEKEVLREQRKEYEVNSQPALLYTKFRTRENYYIYDTHSNAILEVSPVLFDIIDEYLKKGPRNEELAVSYNHKEAEILKAIKDIEEGKQAGYLQPTNLKRMNFYPSDDTLPEEIKHKIRSLGLENTTRCNFRCKYCAFSGHYPDKRTHGNQDMEWETAKNAIDIFFRHSDRVERRKNIGFWGGEPMLNLSLVRKVVNYVNTNYPGEDLFYNFTTNGSLFDNENTDFFIKHKFSINVSLNGPRDIHDKYRIDIKGSGTFDRIMEGLQMIREKDREYYDEYINFSCTLTPNTSQEEVRTFFAENDLVTGKLNLSITSVNPNETTFFEEYGHFSKEETRKKLKLFWQEAVDGTIEEDIFLNQLFQGAMLNIFKRCREPLGDRIHPNGCCIPMLKKMHVDVNGNIHLCERLPGCNPLGNVNEQGIDIDAIVNLVDEYTSNSLNDCRTCWAVRFCPACYKDFLKNNRWYDTNRKELCQEMRSRVLNDLALYSSILEKNPRAFDYLHKIKVSE